MAKKPSFSGALTCAFHCKDLDRTVEWYREHLGFEVLYRMDDIAWCELKTPLEQVTVGFSQTENPKVEGGCTLTFGVRDIDSSRSALEETGVRFDGETVDVSGMVKLAGFYDPDGNKLMFFQSLAPVPG